MFKANDSKKIMKTCIILHSMIIKDKLDDNHVPNFKYKQVDDSPPKLSRNHTTKLMDFIQCYH